MYELFQRRFRPQLLFEGDAKNPGGGTAKVDWPPEVLEGFKSLISKQGSEKDAAMKLYDENYELRKKNRELEDKLESATILSEEEAKRWKAYQELGDDPEKLKESLAQAKENETELQKIKKEQSNSKVAEVMKWNDKALNRIGGDLEYEIKTRKNDDGEDERYVVVKTEDGEKDLGNYAKENWPEMLPALQATSGNEQQQEGSSGKSFTKQKPASTGKPNEGGYLKKALAKNHKAAGIKTDSDDE